MAEINKMLSKPTPLAPGASVVVTMNVDDALSAYPGTIIRQEGEYYEVLCLDDKKSYNVRSAFVYNVEEYNLIVNGYDVVLQQHPISAPKSPIQENIVRISISPLDENDSSWVALRDIFMNTATFKLYANAPNTSKTGDSQLDVKLMGFHYTNQFGKWAKQEPARKRIKKTPPSFYLNDYSPSVNIRGSDRLTSLITQHEAANLVHLWNYNFDEKRQLNSLNCGPLIKASWDILKSNEWIEVQQNHPNARGLGNWIVYKSGRRDLGHYEGSKTHLSLAQAKLILQIVISLQEENNKEFLETLFTKHEELTKASVNTLTQFRGALKAKVDMHCD